MAQPIEENGHWYLNRAEAGKPEEWVLDGDGNPKAMTEEQCRDRMHTGDYADDPQTQTAAPAKAARKARRK